MSVFTVDSPEATHLRYVRDLKDEAERIKRDLDFHTAALAKAGVGTHTVEGIGAFNVAENNTYPEAGFDLTEGQKKRCMTLKWDAAKAAALYPAARAAAKVTNGFKVTLR